MPSTIPNDKKAWRAYVKQNKPPYPNHSGEKLKEKIKQHPHYATWQTIAIYYARTDEVDTRPLIKMLWEQKKQVLIPVCEKNKTLTFHHFTTQSTLIKSPWQTMEPQQKAPCPLQQIDCMIMPTIAFNSIFSSHNPKC